tara:strand:- start:46 stop:552 length:507 start_codon:yes stop_codon:yes gene_type:complete
MRKSDEWDYKENLRDGSIEENSWIKQPNLSHDIKFWMVNEESGISIGNDDNLISIDFLRGMKELEKLKPITFDNNKRIILFRNYTTETFLQIFNINCEWYILPDISEGEVFENACAYVAKVSDEELSTIMRLWFENLPYFELINTWKIWRQNHNGKWDAEELEKIHDK